MTDQPDYRTLRAAIPQIMRLGIEIRFAALDPLTIVLTQGKSTATMRAPADLLNSPAGEHILAEDLLQSAKDLDAGFDAMRKRCEAAGAKT